jgi:hypothetical protein
MSILKMPRTSQQCQTVYDVIAMYLAHPPAARLEATAGTLMQLAGGRRSALYADQAGTAAEPGQPHQLVRQQAA